MTIALVLVSLWLGAAVGFMTAGLIRPASPLRDEDLSAAIRHADDALRLRHPLIAAGVWSDADALGAVLAILAGSDAGRAAMIERARLTESGESA